MKALLTVCLVLSLLWFAGSVWGAALPAGEYMVYDSDTAGEANVLLNYGTASVDVVITDGAGDGSLDNLRIDCSVAGSVKLWSSGELCGTGGVLITDSAAVDLTLTTGVITVGGASLLDWDAVTGGAQPAVHWTADSIAHVTNTAYRAGVTNIAIGGLVTANLLSALDGDLTGSIILDNTSSAITGLTTTAVGDSGDFTGSMTTSADMRHIVIAGTATGTLWDIGDEATGAWVFGTFAVTAVQTAGDWDASLTTVSSNNLTGSFTIGGILNGLITTTGAGADIAANFTVNGATANVAVSAVAGGLETTGGATADITGSFNAPNGTIAGAGTSGGEFVESDGAITSSEITGKNISGNIVAGTSINSAISATDISAISAPVGIGITGSIVAGTTLAGSVTSAAPQGEISSVTAMQGIFGAISSANNIGKITATFGDISGAISGAGDITGAITAGASITGAITAGGSLANNITAASEITGTITARDIGRAGVGSVDIEAQNGAIARVLIADHIGAESTDVAIVADHIDEIYAWQIGGSSGDVFVQAPVIDKVSVCRLGQGTGIVTFDGSIGDLVVTCANPETGSADINRDGIVDLEDAAILAQQWLEIAFANIHTFDLGFCPAWVTQGEWAFGQPLGGGGVRDGNPDPTSGHTGNNVYGVNLSGDYDTATGGPYYLTAGPFDCSPYTNVQLRFVRWLNTDKS